MFPVRRGDSISAIMLDLNPNYEQLKAGPQWQALYEQAVEMHDAPVGGRRRILSAVGRRAFDTHVYEQFGGLAVPSDMEWRQVSEEGKLLPKGMPRSFKRQKKKSDIGFPGGLPPMTTIGTVAVDDLMLVVKQAIKKRLFSCREATNCRVLMSWSSSWNARSLLGTYMSLFSKCFGVECRFSTSRGGGAIIKVIIPTAEAFNHVFQVTTTDIAWLKCEIPAKKKDHSSVGVRVDRQTMQVARLPSYVSRNSRCLTCPSFWLLLG